MPEALQRALELVEQLALEVQDEIAHLIECEFDDRKWDELFASDASARFLEKLTAEARRENIVGLTVESTDRW